MGKGRRNGKGYGRTEAPSSFDIALNSAETGEMNTQFSEKLRMTPTQQNHPVNSNVGRVNKDIRRYVDAVDRLSTSVEGSSFRSEVPTSDEVLDCTDTDSFQTVNIIDRAYFDIPEYLSTQYALLREDSVRPLREAVLTFRSSPLMSDDTNLAVYEKVYITGFTFAHQGLAARIRFSTARSSKKIPWENSKRLVSGSIVALTPASDNFKSKCIVAIIAARPLEGVTAVPPEVDIYFARPQDIEIDPQTEFVMIEARSGYYEATRHVMSAIQKLSTESFPLSQQIVMLDPDVSVPDYLVQSPTLSLGAVDGVAEAVDVVNAWPSSPSQLSSLDESQWAALRRILTKKLAIIQGPPGTGKTYVSVSALKVLLANKTRDDPPIVVAAHTNHALDQLLTHIATFEKNYIRLGGRSTDDEIKRRTLYEVRQKSKVVPGKGTCLMRAIADQKSTTSRLIKTLSPLICDREDPHTVIGADVFVELGLLSQQQADSLEQGASRWTGSESTSDSPLALWLGRNIIPFSVTYKDGTFGFQEETESLTDQEFEQVKELEAEYSYEEDERDILHGTYKSVADSWTIPRASLVSAATIQNCLARNQDLWNIPAPMRGPTYAYLQKQAKNHIGERFRDQAGFYEKARREIQIGKFERDSLILEKCNVVGMTMTGLSKYRALIAGIKPKIILIEEAAEVLEGPVAVACLESLEHLILVGDHQQLQPSTSVGQLGRPPFNLNISLFERLVNNGIPFDTLNRQRRMDPQFRKLLTPIYKTLEDHPSVENRGGPPGCKFKLWMFSHDWPESTDGSFSKKNDREALMVAAFFNYLVLQGIPASNITVLVFYNAQRKLILRELRKNNRIAGSYLRVYTVDSYQGEENDVILLSLVRSGTDENKSIGFCGIPNRVCVALSRARLGFYLFGKAKQLFDASDLWREILTIFIKGQSDRRVDYHIPLVCTKHGRETAIKDPDDFQRFNGGCDLDCPDILDCGHRCPHKCHPYKHSEIICPAKCQKKLICGHACKKICGDSLCFCPCDIFASHATSEGIVLDPSPPVSTAMISPSSQTMAISSMPSQAILSRPENAEPEPRFMSRQALLQRPKNQRTPSPQQNGKKTPFKISPEKWQTYAGGGVKRDDELRDQAAAAKRGSQIMRNANHPVRNVMDSSDSSSDIAVVRARLEAGLNIGSNGDRTLLPAAPLAEGIISETTREIEDGRTIFKHKWALPSAAETGGPGHNTDAGGSTNTAEDAGDLLIEL